MIGKMLIILHVVFCSVIKYHCFYYFCDITFESTLEYIIIYIRQELVLFFLVLEMLIQF